MVTEEECIRRDTKFFPVLVRRKENGHAVVMLFEFVGKTRAEQRSLTGGELSRENFDEFEHGGWWQKKSVDPVNDTILCILLVVRDTVSNVYVKGQWIPLRTTSTIVSLL